MRASQIYEQIIKAINVLPVFADDARDILYDIGDELIQEMMDEYDAIYGDGSDDSFLADQVHQETEIHRVLGLDRKPAQG